MAGAGFEQPPENKGNSGFSSKSGAKSGALAASADNLADSDSSRLTSLDSDPLLARFLDAWNRLSDDDRLHLVDEAERMSDEL